MSFKPKFDLPNSVEFLIEQLCSELEDIISSLEKELDERDSRISDLEAHIEVLENELLEIKGV